MTTNNDTVIIPLMLGYRGGKGQSKKREALEPLVSHFGVRWGAWQQWCYRHGGYPTDPELFIKRFLK